MAEEKKVLSFVKKDKNAMVAPSKKTMNFVHHQSAVNVKKLIPLAVILIIAAVLFAKFGILDPINEKTAAIRDFSAAQQRLDEINMKMAAYDDLENDYGRYSYGWMSEKETGLVDRMEIINLLEKKVMREATVRDFSVNSNVVTTNISGITLDQASKIVNDLEASPLVKSATVYSAAADDGSEATIFMSIVLEKEAEAK